jgi:hypothetical protein
MVDRSPGQPIVLFNHTTNEQSYFGQPIPDSRYYQSLDVICGSNLCTLCG